MILFYSVRSATDNEDERVLTNKLFGMVGGLAFSTLVINGISAGPALKALGLAKPSETHKKLSEHYMKMLRRQLVESYADLMTDKRFAECDFGNVKRHLAYFENVPEKEIGLAMEHAAARHAHRSKIVSDVYAVRDKSSALSPSRLEKSDEFGEKELRLLFLELLRGAYSRATKEGFLDARVDNGYLYYLLTQSLEFAGDVVNRGGPIVGWEFTESKQVANSKSFTERIKRGVSKRGGDNEQRERRTNMLKAFVFQDAHRKARKLLKAEFADDADDALTEASKIILDESEKQEQFATDFLDSVHDAEKNTFVSHYACLILLNKAADSVEKHNTSGLLKDTEAQGFLELIDEAVQDIHACVHKHAIESSG